jgi:RNA polymerase sigma-70 factor (ECF subfamily)
MIEEAFKTNERFLWSLCYRLTGNAADADDIVQETFLRAMNSPPARTDKPWRPWLVRVAMNIGRDLLRRRRRQPYDGPWLPSPIETGDEASPPSYEPVDEAGGPLAHYDLLESVSFAFLLALEALTPAQRAVLLLRDVFDYSVRETAEALAMTESNVKTTHNRARRAMRAYDRSRQPPTQSLQQRTRQMMERFMACLASHDVAGAEALLAADARHLSDGGGEFVAARVPITGARKIVTFNVNLMKWATAHARAEWRMFNGLPAIFWESDCPPPGYPPRSVTTCTLDADGRIQSIHTVVATRKLGLPLVIRQQPVSQEL